MQRIFLETALPQAMNRMMGSEKEKVEGDREALKRKAEARKAAQ